MKKDSGKCGYCGKADHSSKLSDRRKSCPAFELNCSSCQINGHFASMCRSKATKDNKSRDKKSTNKVSEVKADEPQPSNDQGSLGTLSGSWFLINGRENAESDSYEVTDVFTSVRQPQATNTWQPPKLAAISSALHNKKLRHHIQNSFGTVSYTHLTLPTKA